MQKFKLVCRSFRMMDIQVILVVMTSLVVIINVSCTYGNAGLCSTLLLPLGYSCKEYQVRTEDGFILAVQRVSKGNPSYNLVSGKPVFLQHGLFQAGDTWFLNPEEESLGFLLVNHGFDVWVGNVRGTRWSYGHSSLSIKSKEFWDWSWEELAMYDLPAMIEFVHNVTHSKVHYIGHSQGTIMAFAAFTDSKVSEMIAAAALLSPISFLGHVTSSFALASTHLQIDKVLETLGIHEISLQSKSLSGVLGMICSHENVDCSRKITSITGPNCCINDSRISYYLEYEPHSTSTKNFRHLLQMIRKGTFERYDYGWAANLRRYSRLSPPSFPLSEIPDNLPLWMSYGGQDALADPQDIKLTLENLKFKPQILYLQNYAHLDFIYSVTAGIDLYNDLITFFKRI